VNQDMTLPAIAGLNEAGVGMRTSGAPATRSGNLVAANSLLGPVGNIDAYIQAVNRVPLLTAAEEQRLAIE